MLGLVLSMGRELRRGASLSACGMNMAVSGTAHREEIRLGPSLSLIERDSRVSGVWHGERTPLRAVANPTRRDSPVSSVGRGERTSRLVIPISPLGGSCGFGDGYEKRNPPQAIHIPLSQ